MVSLLYCRKLKKGKINQNICCVTYEVSTTSTTKGEYQTGHASFEKFDLPKDIRDMIVNASKAKNADESVRILKNVVYNPETPWKYA